MMTLSLAAITGLVALSPEATLTAAGILVALIGFVGLLVKEMSEITTSYDKNGAKIKKSSASFAPLFASLLVLLIGTKKVLIAMLAVAAAIKFLGPGAVAGATAAMIVIMGAVIGAVLAIQAIMWKYMKEARKDIVVKMASFALIMAGIAAVVLAIGASVAIIGLLPKEKIEAVTGLLTSVILAIGLIVIAVKEINKHTAQLKAPSKKDTGKLSRGLETLKNMAVLMAAMSIAVIGVAAAAVLIAKADTKSLNKAMGVFLAIAALIGVVSYLSQGAGGSTVLATIRYLGVVAAAFAVAVALLAVAFKTLSTMSEDEVKKTIKNLNMLVDDLNKNSFNYGTAIGLFIGNIIAAIVSSLGSSVKQLADGLIDMVNGVLDSVLEKGPAFFNKIWDTIIMVLKSIKERAGEVTMQLVEALVAVINGLANAIGEHRSEIVEAVNKLFEEVIKTVVQLLARLFGVAKEDLEDFADYVLPWAKRISLALIGIFAYKKIKDGADKTFKLFDSLKNIGSSVQLTAYKMKHFIANAKTMAQHYGGYINAIKAGAIQLPGILANAGSVLSKIAGFAASHPFALLAVGAGIAFKKIIDSSTEAMRVTTHNDEVVRQAMQPILEDEARLNELYKQRKDAFTDIDKEADHNNKVLETLREMVDQNGKIKAGYETRVGLLKNQLSGALNIEIDAQTQVVSVIDEQNNKLDIQSKKITEIMEKKRLQAKLEKAEEQISETREKLESGYYSKQEAAALKAKQDFEKAKFTYYNESSKQEYTLDYTNADMLRMEKEYKEMQREMKEAGKEFTGERRKRYKMLESFERNDFFLDVNAAMSALDVNVANATQNTIQATAAVKNVDKAFAAMDGTLEEAKEAMAGLNFNLVLSDAGASVQQVINQFGQYAKEFDELVASGASITPETKQRYEDLFKALAESLGDSPEGREYLKSVGYNSSGSWISGAEERIKEEANKGLKSTVMYGVALAEGLEKGIISKEEYLVALMNRTADKDIIEPIKKKLGIASPSKVFKQLGTFTMLGLINGVTSKEDALKKTYSAMAASNIAAYTSAMSSNVSSIPFTPVLNTSGIQNGTRILQGQLSGLTTNPIGATLTSRLAASVDTSQIDTDNSRIVSSLADLKTELYELGEKMANLQVVMDTGATVGALAPGMDMELGRRTVRKQRGV